MDPTQSTQSGQTMQPQLPPQSSTAALAPSTSNIKRLSTVNKQQTSPSKKSAPTLPVAGSSVKDVVSPGELCGFVDSLLNSLETRFDDMSEQILSRMDDMSSRIDNLETSVQDLMHEGIDAGSSPTAKR